MIILKFICILLAVIYGYANTGRILARQNVTSAQVILMSIGIAGFITLQWLM